MSHRDAERTAEEPKRKSRNGTVAVRATVAAARPEKLRSVTVIYVYGDDGADEKKERVRAVAVIAGTEEWWQRVEDDWVVRCGGIPFHATDCESNRKDYESVPHDETKAMYRDLTGILAASSLGGIGVAIDVTAQKKIMPGALPLGYYRAFLECIERAANVGQNLKDVAKLTFDISTEDEYNATVLYKWARDTDPRLRQWLDPEIAFVHWRDSPRVQAADLLAFEAWKALDHTVGPVRRKRRSWELLRATQRFETLSYSEQWFTDYKKHLDSGELEKIVGFNVDDYRQWLRENNRQHSTSNLFHFLEWIGNAMKKENDKHVAKA